MTRKRKLPPTVAVTTTLAVVLVGYVLSYAPYIQYRYGEDPPPPQADSDGDYVMVSYDFDDPYFAENNHAFYAPVEWLIDETPVEGPMLWWAGVWDVEGKVSRDSDARNSSPIEYGDSWEVLSNPSSKK